MKFRTTPKDADKDNKETKTAQILSRSSNLSLLSLVDAGDVIECYILRRIAKLEQLPFNSPNVDYKSKNSTRNSNAMKNVSVQKTAIAFRFNPNPSSSDLPFQLILEYGPARTGSSQSRESIPTVNGHSSNSGEEDSIYLSWENDAKIYFTTSISQEEWIDYEYMAPITGAVLGKVMDYIYDYPIQHPRYQPFTVVTKQSERIILKSSNSDDFAWNVFEKLSDFFVNIDPILPPFRYIARLFVEDAGRDVIRLLGNKLLKDSEEVIENNSNGRGRKEDGDKLLDESDQGGKNVANAAAIFYENFYACANAIQSGDYSAFETAVPTLNPSNPPTDMLITNPPTGIFEMRTTHPSTDIPITNPPTNVPITNPLTDMPITNPPTGMPIKNPPTEVPITNLTTRMPTSRPTIMPTSKPSIIPTFYTPNILPLKPTAEETISGTNPPSNKSDKKTNYYDTIVSNENDRELNQNNPQQIRSRRRIMEDTQSGNYVNMAISCFADPRYKISKTRHILDGKIVDNDEHEFTVTTNFAYIYIDGLNYYRLNLTSPYFDSVPTIQSITKPQMKEPGKGDLIDWTLALLILILFIIGLLVMLHHVGLINYDKRLKLTSFFQPNHDNLYNDIQYTSPEKNHPIWYDNDSCEEDSLTTTKKTESNETIELCRISSKSGEIEMVDDSLDCTKLVFS